MIALLVVPLGVAVALSVLFLPAWASVGVLGLVVLVLLRTLRAHEVARAQGTDTQTAGVVYLCGCFLLVPATGVHFPAPGQLSSVFSLLSVGQLAATAMLGVVLVNRKERHSGRRLRSFALPLWALLVVGSIVAFLWTAAPDSVGFIGEFVLVALPAIIAMRRFGPTRDEALSFMKAWTLGVLLSCAAGLTFARFPSGRSNGFSSHPNQFGMTAAMAIPIVWGLYVNRRLTRTQAYVAYAVLLGAVLSSGARSALLAAAIGIMILLYRSLGALKMFAGGVLLSALGYFLLSGAAASVLPTGGALGRLLDSSSTTASDQGRVEKMSSGLERVSSFDHAVLGAGWVRYHQPHNLLLLAWDGAGLLGILAILLLVAVPVVLSAKVKTEAFEWSLAVGALVFVAAAFLNNAITAPFAWVVFALMEFRWADPDPDPDPGPPPAAVGADEASSVTGDHLGPDPVLP